MSKMSDMAMTIEELRSAAAAINEAANWLAEQFGGTADKAPAKEPAAKEDMLCSRPSAVRNGLAGSWSKVDPTASIPMRRQSSRQLQMPGLIHMKRSSLVSLPCRSVLANPDSMSCLPPILKSRKVNRRSCRRAINVRQ